MVWRRVKRSLGWGIVLVQLGVDVRVRPEQVEMPDTMEVMRAMQDPAARDAMLDTMPAARWPAATRPPRCDSWMARGDVRCGRD